MKSVLQKIIKSGTNDREKFIADKIEMSNVIALIIAFGLALPFGVISLLYFPSLTILPVICFIVVIFAIYLHTLGFCRFSRLVIALSPVFLALIWGALLMDSNKEPIYHYLIVPFSFSFIPSLLFDIKKETKLFIVAILISCVAFAFFPTLNSYLETSIDDSLIRFGWLGKLILVLGIFSGLSNILTLAMLTAKSEELAMLRLEKVNEQFALIQDSEANLKNTIEELETTQENMKKVQVDLEKEHVAVQLANKKISDSINYAQRIQKAIIPQISEIRENIPQTAMFYKSKDVVSGDFPYFFKKDDYFYYAAVDCTGHGVPGAMMSLIGHLLLNDILNGSEILEPGEVLNRLHKGVVKTLKQDDPNNKSADGMDIALCRIKDDLSEVLYAGAHRPLYQLKKSQEEVIQHKGSKFPIGGSQYGGKNNFDSHKVEIEKGDTLYFFSDGYPDQFGGENGLKFGPKRMRKLIQEQKEISVEKVVNLFENKYNNWLADGKQIDDVLLIGIEF